MSGGVSRLFSHGLPLRNFQFSVSPDTPVTVVTVSSNDVPAVDPLTGLAAEVLTPPFRQLYALLWRVGVVKIVD
ncbi:Rv1535 domain-containing protein [Mycobacteroides franklinii]|uniref:Rv1535 domain-containing protein n=1 Tax=Mycobacteroides franklinii TaxID=948102 RepID=UPI003AF7139D